jgi:hypothetical protein
MSSFLAGLRPRRSAMTRLLDITLLARRQRLKAFTWRATRWRELSMQQPGLDQRHRDKDGTIARKRTRERPQEKQSSNGMTRRSVRNKARH